MLSIIEAMLILEGAAINYGFAGDTDAAMRCHIAAAVLHSTLVDLLRIVKTTV